MERPRRQWELRCRFATEAGPVVRRGMAAVFYPQIVKTAVKTALVVGTVLTLINHGPDLAAHRLSRIVVGEILLTYLVPYAVATYGAVSVSRVR